MRNINNIIERSFSINLNLMVIFSLYRSEKSQYFSKTQAYFTYSLFIVLVPFLILLYFLIGEQMDSMQLNYSGMFLVSAMGYVTKLFPFIRDEAKIRKCINYFAAPIFLTCSREETEIIDNCVKICRRNIIILVTLVTIGAFGWIVGPLLRKGYILPVDVWLPFNPRSDLKTYYSVYTFLAIAGTYMGFAGCVVDPLIGGLACHAATQLMVLQHKLHSLNKNAEKEKNFSLIYDNIRHCIKLHDAVLKFVTEYENCFSFVVLSQFAASAFVICFCCLQLTIVPVTNVNNAITSVSCGCVALAQVYFYCYYGTMLSEEHNNVVTAIYMSTWYEYDENSKSLLFLMMERSKNPIRVTAGKIFDLSLDTFKTLLKRSYSLLAVLKNFQ